MPDDLRDLRFDDEPEIDFESEEDTFLEDRSAVQSDRTFLGMTAVERMFLSIFLFMNVVVLGLALLLATRRIVF
jgi:hypothetical protein